MPRTTDDKLLTEAYEKMNEGLWDRLKARGAGLKGGIKGAGQRIAGTAKGAMAGATGNIAGVQAASAQRAAGQGMGLDAKSLSLVNSHLGKLNKVLSDFENDLSKLGMDPETIKTSNPEAAQALTSIKTALSQVTNAFKPGQVRAQAVTGLQNKVNPSTPPPVPAQ